MNQILSSLLTACCAFSLFHVDCEAKEAGPQPQIPAVLLQMIRDDAVHDELSLSDAQRGQIMEVLSTIDGRWFRSRNLPLAKQTPEIRALSETLKARLRDILSPQQFSRVGELERQALGTRMVMRDDVAELLGLTTKQRATFRDAFVETDTQSKAAQKKQFDGQATPEATSAEINRLKAKERQTLVDGLTQEQKAKLGSLTGNSFNFASVKRMYPMAPEFESAGVTWIQGGPLTLEQLRGKVVAIHFYAFQCINCQRNFPHYKAWHDDYANQDLVVIGIQTPETSAERKLDRVAAAVKSDGLEFPVMLDADSSNWKSWSNTMWPTVYLIDKQGFIRRWWQGELNWKGTPGEQQMRQTIEQLLAEDS